MSDSARSLKSPARRFSSRSVTSGQFIAFTTSRQYASRSLTMVVVRAGCVVVGALVGAGAACVDVVVPGALPDLSPSRHPLRTTATASAASIQFRPMSPVLSSGRGSPAKQRVRWFAPALVGSPPIWAMMPLCSGTHHRHSDHPAGSRRKATPALIAEVTAQMVSGPGRGATPGPLTPTPYSLHMKQRISRFSRYGSSASSSSSVQR
jgi:hypothetical protein